jgi:hypothetical protein
MAAGAAAAQAIVPPPPRPALGADELAGLVVGEAAVVGVGVEASERLLPPLASALLAAGD